MNKELIQLFLNRACYDEQDQRELEDWINVEKFTELIVRECVDIAKQVDKNPYLEDHYHARQIIKNINKHFGVE
jgi:hypothetical protein